MAGSDIGGAGAEDALEARSDAVTWRRAAARWQRLLAAERAARQAAEAAQNHLAFLSEATRVLVDGVDPHDVLVRLARTAVPLISDWAAVYVPRGSVLDRIGLFAAKPHHAPTAARFAGRHGYDIDGPSTVAVAFREQRLVHVTDLCSAQRDVPVEVASAWRDAGLRETVVVPIVAGDRSHAVLSLAMEDGGRTFADADIALVQELATRAGRIMDRAVRFEQEHVVAQALVRSVLPAALPGAAGLLVAGRYRPAASGLEVGGDWFDAVVADGRLVVAVGDIAGHGVAVAAAMAQVRSALRAYLLDGHGPAAALQRTARYAASMASPSGTDQLLAAVICGEVDLDEPGRVRLANAGQPPPVLVGQGEARLLPVRAQPPLGCGTEAAVTEVEVELPIGGSLVLYTDGLVEHRQVSLDRRLTDLCAAAATWADLAPDPLCDAALADLTAGAPADDCCVLAVRREA